MLAPPGYKPQHPSRATNQPWVSQQARASVNLPEVPVRLPLLVVLVCEFVV